MKKKNIYSSPPSYERAHVARNVRERSEKARGGTRTLVFFFLPSFLSHKSHWKEEKEVAPGMLKYTKLRGDERDGGAEVQREIRHRQTQTRVR